MTLTGSTFDGNNGIKDVKYYFKKIVKTIMTLTRLTLFPLNRSLLSNKDKVI